MSNNKVKIMYKVFYYYFIILGFFGMNMLFVIIFNFVDIVIK